MIPIRDPDDDDDDIEEIDSNAANAVVDDEDDDDDDDVPDEIALDDEGNIKWELSLIPASVHKADITSPIRNRLARMCSIRLVVGSTYFDSACKRT